MPRLQFIIIKKEVKAIKPIPNFSNYFVNEAGKIFSAVSGNIRELKPYEDSKKRYLLIGIYGDDGVRYKCLVHRLVATAYLPNPNNYPEVNHKDNNPKNNSLENFEWCTRKQNLKQSYLTMSPVRNFKTCKLYKGTKLIACCKSIQEASLLGKSLGYSYSSLNRNLKCKDLKIIKD